MAIASLEGTATDVATPPGSPLWRQRRREAAARSSFRYRLPASISLVIALGVILALESRFIPTPWLGFTAALQLTPALGSVALNAMRVLAQPSESKLVQHYLPKSEVIALLIASANGGSALIVYEFAESEYRVLYLMILAGISGLQAVIMAINPVVSALVLLATLSPQVVWFVLSGVDSRAFMISVTFIWLFLMLGIVRETRKLILENVEVSIRNEIIASDLQQKIDEVQSARRAAEAAHASRTRFFAAASHDLRQPLHALGLLSELLEDADEPDLRRSLTQRIRTSLTAADGLLEEVLQLSRFDASVVLPRIEAIHVGSLLTEVQSTWAAAAAQAGRPLVCEPTDAWIATDRGLLFRALGNLVGNAVRHATGATHIALGAQRNDCIVTLTVSDDGAGIPASEHQAIFDEFVQGARAQTDPRGGLGLGLAIVRRTVDLLGHDIRFESHPSQHTVFALDVPAANPTNAAQTANASRLPECVLVIEDDDASAAALVALLRRWGVRSSLAACESGVRQVLDEHGPPDAVIADVRLPNGDNGQRLVEIIERQAGRSVPTVFVTGDTPDALRSRDAALAAVVLFKPVSPAKLRAGLSDVLDECDRQGASPAAPL